MRSKSNTDGDELTNDRKQVGPYKGVETQGKRRQSLTLIQFLGYLLKYIQLYTGFHTNKYNLTYIKQLRLTGSVKYNEYMIKYFAKCSSLN